MRSWRGSSQVKSHGFTRIDNIAQRLEGRRLSRVLQPMEMEVGKCSASEGEYFEGDKNDVPDNT
jgi:hypothetical protein